MIYVTGDVHGELSRIDEIEQRITPEPSDYIVVCGDFGFVFTGGKLEEKVLDYLSQKKYTLLFVDGNHENHVALNKYPTEEWCGGSIHRIRDNIIHLMRGQVFVLEGKRLFTFGGAFSTDRGYRKLNYSYWDEEIPTADEISLARENLAKHGNVVDYIFTHTLPTSVIKLKGFYVDDKMPDKKFTDYLDEVRESIKYKKWFAGHFHLDEYANQTDNIRILYKSIDYLD